MTDESLFFDTDCLSAFLWVKEECILTKLYPGKIVIPQKVYEELSNPRIPHLKQRIDLLVSNDLVTIQPIYVGSHEYDLYLQFTKSPQNNHKIIGEGEAASLALALSNNGILASNNLKDIKQYIETLKLKHTTTGDILFDAYKQGFISLDDTELIWKQMLSKRRKLGANSFQAFMNIKKEKIVV